MTSRYILITYIEPADGKIFHLNDPQEKERERERFRNYSDLLEFSQRRTPMNNFPIYLTKLIDSFAEIPWSIPRDTQVIRIIDISSGEIFFFFS